MSLIDRQAAIDALNKEIIKRRLLDDINDGMLDEFDTENILRKLPSAQPERKKGKWRHYEDYLTCSECRTEYDDDIMTHCGDDVPKFCPNCGADMRGNKHETD